MVTLIKQLIARGHAYEAGGEVLFDTQSMPDYGALSGRKLDEQQAGARVAVDAHKKHPTDFVLWKLSSENEPGWESPWGRGRPGWHIECSAMSAAYLGEVFDIHGGGLDLIFPHHENEIAQSRCAHGTPVMANYWMHNGFLQVEGEKMSKSLGNFVTIRELLNDWPGEVLRLNMLKTHYRSPIDWTLKGLEESAKVLDEWYALSAVIDVRASAKSKIHPPMLEALRDDLNTPKAISELHQLRNRAVHGEGVEFLESLVDSLEFLGLRTVSSEEWTSRKQVNRGVDGKAVDDLLLKRKEARARKDFKESDRIRDELAAIGVVLKDGKDADGKPVTTWEIAR
jgi:cysteinyl-tRNA synthetase